MMDLVRIIVPLLLAAFCSIAKAEEDLPQPKKGNFALPQTQQPSPMIGFGQNIVDKGQTQLFIFASDYAGINQHFITATPSLLYGITDSLSLFLSLPYSVSNQVGSHHSSGFNDGSAQLEYAFIDKAYLDHTTQATIVANVSMYNGSAYKTPNTGVGAPSLFLGTTFDQTYMNWFYFFSPGATFTVAKSGTKYGNSYLYQFGFGRHLFNTEKWLFAWMVEGDGTYSQKNRLSGVLNPNSGGNVFYLTPSFWASSKKIIFQVGAGYAVGQHLFGNQPRNTYLLATNLGWDLQK